KPRLAGGPEPPRRGGVERPARAQLRDHGRRGEPQRHAEQLRQAYERQHPKASLVRLSVTRRHAHTIDALLPLHVCFPPHDSGATPLHLDGRRAHPLRERRSLLRAVERSAVRRAQPRASRTVARRPSPRCGAERRSPCATWRGVIWGTKRKPERWISGSWRPRTI